MLHAWLSRVVDAQGIKLLLVKCAFFSFTLQSRSSYGVWNGRALAKFGTKQLPFSSIPIFALLSTVPTSTRYLLPFRRLHINCVHQQNPKQKNLVVNGTTTARVLVTNQTKMSSMPITNVASVPRSIQCYTARKGEILSRLRKIHFDYKTLHNNQLRSFWTRTVLRLTLSRLLTRTVWPRIHRSWNIF